MRKNREGVPKPSPARLRCAIYTRKSTEEGLEQEFNSLDAQREAAQAFIQSQRREGWIALPELYDDGGFTGANMDRPALTRLLQAVEAGTLDCVVVYKVDRLSRSLLDFTRMLSVFEKHQVSFVAVTQQFNTSTSLGRLTLNILLSFAQFERELIGERTRDKMAAARRKGKWVGGCPVLGYDVDPGGGRLVVNEAEAERVRAIFALFEENRSTRLTLAEIERRGWRLKSWTRQTGQFRPGGPFALNSLRWLLTNILYTGWIRHKGQTYPGEHAAILAPGTWERVQNLITHPAALAHGKARNKHLALLSGLLYCESCAARMVYSYSGKNDRQYPYYVCLNAQRKGWAVCPAKSLPARGIEESVLGRIREAQRGHLDPSEWEQMDRSRQVEALQAIIERIGYDGTARRISIRFHPAATTAAGEQART
ncbi:MAG TPA: recombinase family protein [Bryobacteraceae bacterium]|nr:recombinase family protein [Bryobacteraceae bacterium]